ncbi:hypothetical protein KKB83_01035 [Patescibacteria group bacterium]|nr:hypothetical protein [Patescibacteria group bacterium]
MGLFCCNNSPTPTPTNGAVLDSTGCQSGKSHIIPRFNKKLAQENQGDLAGQYSAVAAARTRMPKGTILRNNFIGGIAWGFGTVIGATVLVGLVGSIISIYGDIPVLGNLIKVIARIAREGTSSIP